MTFGRLLLRLTPLMALAVLGPPALAQDAADMVVRIGRLEGQIRQLQGQIEQLQYQNRRLEEQFKKFQEDVEFRFQEGAGPVKPARPAAAAPAQSAPQVAPQGAGPSPIRPLPAQPQQKRGDAFDPHLQPAAPGAPRPLGTPGAPPATPAPRAAIAQDADPIETVIAEDPDAPAMDDVEQGPLDLATAAKGAPAAPESPRLAGLPTPASGAGEISGGALPPLTGALPAPGAGAPAAQGSGMDEYEQAYLLVQQRQYEQAEAAFRQFLQGHPKDKMAPHALYWLGESYLRRSRFEDAAEQYLKVYQNYGRSRVAPDSLVKLASALRGMGQKDQACATLAEVGRKYPAAPADVRASVEREQKKSAC